MQQKTYECNKCKKSFQNNQLQYEKITDNMSFSAPAFDLKVFEKKGIPKCPYCGELAFFGFEIIDIAF